MSREEQQEVKKKYYLEALRYMDNAKETLKRAIKDGRYYTDEKYVKTASGTAYNGVLKALDGYLLVKGVELPKGKSRKSIEYYISNVAKIDHKLLNYLNGAYQTLHLAGYYDGNRSVPVIQSGFDEAYEVIERIKPMEM